MRIEFNNDNVKSASNHVNFLIKDNNNQFNLYIVLIKSNLEINRKKISKFMRGIK